MFSSQNSKAHSKPLQCYILPAGCARSVRPAGPKIAFMFSVCVCVCVCVCACVCVFVQKDHVHYVTMPL